MTFDFEELPTDIIYCIVRLLSYRQSLPLSLTNKRIHHALMQNQYVINHFTRRYFTGVDLLPFEFPKKYKYEHYIFVGGCQN
jgi:hypothetical protein